METTRETAEPSIISLRRPVPFFVAAFVLSAALSGFGKMFHQDLPSELAVVMEHLAHFAEIAGFIGVAIYLIEELAERMFVPWLTQLNTTVDGTSQGIVGLLESFQRELINVVQAKQFVVELGSQIYYKKQEEQIDRELVRDANSSHPVVLDALNRARDGGDDPEAIKTLRDFANQDRRFCRELLLALVMSVDPTDWREAERYLEEFGDAKLYNRLALAHWYHKDLQKAVELAEKGYKFAKERANQSNYVPVLANSLAYYYADLYWRSGIGVEARSEALRLGEEAVKFRNAHSRGSLEHAEALDTLGFVQIAFAKELSEVTRGLENCAQPKAIGSTQALFELHLQAGQEKIAKLVQTPGPFIQNSK